jgi:hypothetical protein
MSMEEFVSFLKTFTMGIITRSEPPFFLGSIKRKDKCVLGHM